MMQLREPSHHQSMVRLILGRLSNFFGGSACLAFYHPCHGRTQDQWAVSDVLLLSSLKEKMQYKLYKWFKHTTF